MPNTQPSRNSLAWPTPSSTHSTRLRHRGSLLLLLGFRIFPRFPPSLLAQKQTSHIAYTHRSCPPLSQSKAHRQFGHLRRRHIPAFSLVLLMLLLHLLHNLAPSFPAFTLAGNTISSLSGTTFFLRCHPSSSQFLT